MGAGWERGGVPGHDRRVREEVEGAEEEPEELRQEEAGRRGEGGEAERGRGEGRWCDGGEDRGRGGGGEEAPGWGDEGDRIQRQSVLNFMFILSL